jgi:hypothetical protein
MCDQPPDICWIRARGTPRAWGADLAPTGLMPRRIAALVCTLSVVQASVCSAQGIGESAKRVPVPTVVDNYDGPFRRASLSRSTVPSTAPNARAQSDDDGSRGSWMERHPVLTGALLGFGVGFGLTYAVAAGDDKDEFLTPVGAGGPALVYGGIAAGFGALAGWGIGRNR